MAFNRSFVWVWATAESCSFDETESSFSNRPHLGPSGERSSLQGDFFLPRGSVTRAPYFSRSLFWKLNPGERLPRITPLGVVM